jgi:predicted nucleic acid-binding protein
MIVVSDTSVITNLAAINCLEILSSLYGKVIIPEAVYSELTNNDIPVPGGREVQQAEWIEVKSVGDRQLVNRIEGEEKLDLGESEAIVIALEIKADLLLIDERRGREVANRKGLKITGLLGVLIEAKQKNIITRIKPLIDELITTYQFRLSQPLYDKIMTMAGEQ